MTDSTSIALSTSRDQLFQSLSAQPTFDLAIIGGGATGLGLALDAALRGLRVVLVEARDFASGTSSKATKLVHGGVRYLAQGNVSLVKEALHERASFLRIAPHLAQPLAFVMPSYKCWETPFYGAGLKAYDLLAGRDGLGHTRFLNAQQTRQHLPGVQPRDLKGGVKYWDAQFDDARMAVALARSAAAAGACVLNYAEVERLRYEGDRVSGFDFRDTLTGDQYRINAQCVINATGVWVDRIRQLDHQVAERYSKPIVSPSQGVHLVVDRDFLPSTHALLVPKTQDGRVLFAVPWLGKVILGTTDTPTDDLSYEPKAFEQEIAFILREAGKYLQKAPTRADVRSVWVGLRPLVRPLSSGQDTKRLSREHTILISPSKLVTVTGGKWTTYRSMAENVLQHVQQEGLLPHLPAATTAQHRLVGAQGSARASATAPRSLVSQSGVEAYGDEQALLQQLPGADRVLALGLTEAMVRFAAWYEYAITVEDVLARRYRLLFLDSRLAAQVAPQVAEILREERAADPQLETFLSLCQQYQLA